MFLKIKFYIKPYVHSLIVLLTVSIVINSCNKFDEGVNFSIRSEEKRLINTWEYISVFDISTSKLQTSGFEGWTETLKKDGTYEKKIIYFSDESFYTGTWQYDGETTLTLSYIVHQNQIDETFEIKRLSNKELFLKNSEKEIHLKKK